MAININGFRNNSVFDDRITTDIRAAATANQQGTSFGNEISKTYSASGLFRSAFSKYNINIPTLNDGELSLGNAIIYCKWSGTVRAYKDITKTNNDMYSVTYSKEKLQSGFSSDGKIFGLKNNGDKLYVAINVHNTVGDTGTFTAWIRIDKDLPSGFTMSTTNYEGYGPDTTPGKSVIDENDNNSNASSEMGVSEDIYASAFDTTNYADEMEYFDLYFNKTGSDSDDIGFQADSFNNVIGMPMQFMKNVDARYGSSSFGKAYTQNILLDAPICVIQAGNALMNGTTATTDGDSDILTDNALTRLYNKAINAYHIATSADLGDTFWERISNELTTSVLSTNSRYYSFQSDYNKMVQYTNTLCHLFAHFLGITDKKIPGTEITYGQYNDTIENANPDKGQSMYNLFGPNKSIFIYYQPDSSISNSFTNSSSDSNLAEKLDEVSNYAKQFAYFAGAIGAPGRNGVSVGKDVDTGMLSSLATQLGNGSGNFLSRIFSRAGEGITTIIGGNNLQLPEMYTSSTNDGTDYTLKIKLVNPYGTPEGAFLFQLRHLARLLAISLPRQYGPNGYTSPFIIRASSKGQFAIQLGLVQTLNISRAGSGGENQTVHHIPQELEVTMTLKDLYQQITISNESNLLNNSLGLLFNNIGLLDFTASFTGYNLNQPDIGAKFDYAIDVLKNTLDDRLSIKFIDGRIKINSPYYERMVADTYLNVVNKFGTFYSP